NSASPSPVIQDQPAPGRQRTLKTVAPLPITRTAVRTLKDLLMLSRLSIQLKITLLSGLSLLAIVTLLVGASLFQSTRSATLVRDSSSEMLEEAARLRMASR